MAQGRVSLSLSESASLLFCSEVADYIPKNKLIFLASHPPNMFVHFQVTPLDEPWCLSHPFPVSSRKAKLPCVTTQETETSRCNHC